MLRISQYLAVSLRVGEKAERISRLGYIHAMACHTALGIKLSTPVTPVVPTNVMLRKRHQAQKGSSVWFIYIKYKQAKGIYTVGTSLGGVGSRRGVSGAATVPIMFYVLICMLVTWVYSACEKSSSCTLCVVFCLHRVHKRKVKRWPAFSR